MDCISRRNVTLGAGAALVALSQPARAAIPTYREFIYGDTKARVTVIEYASLTCHFCAGFARDTWPLVKQNYVETGKIRFVYRDFPTDGLAMAAAVLCRCADERGPSMVEMLFKKQDEWAHTAQPLVPLKQYAQLAGMSAGDVDACLINQDIIKACRDTQQTAVSLYQVRVTPTFYVADEKVEGAASYDVFAKILDKHLALAK